MFKKYVAGTRPWLLPLLGRTGEKRQIWYIYVLELDLKSICRNMTTAHFELQKSLHPIFPMPPIKKGMWHEIVYL